MIQGVTFILPTDTVNHDTNRDEPQTLTRHTDNYHNTTYFSYPTHPTPLAFFLCPHSSAFLFEQSSFCYQKKLASLGKAGQELAWEVSLF